MKYPLSAIAPTRAPKCPRPSSYKSRGNFAIFTVTFFVTLSLTEFKTVSVAVIVYVVVVARACATMTGADGSVYVVPPVVIETWPTLPRPVKEYVAEKVIFAYAPDSSGFPFESQRTAVAVIDGFVYPFHVAFEVIESVFCPLESLHSILVVNVRSLLPPST